MACSTEVKKNSHKLRVNHIECHNQLGSVCFNWIMCRNYAGNLESYIALQKFEATNSGLVLTNQTLADGSNPSANYLLTWSPATHLQRANEPVNEDGLDYVKLEKENPSFTAFTVCIQNIPAGKYKLHLKETREANNDNLNRTTCTETLDFEILDLTNFDVFYTLETSTDCNNEGVKLIIHTNDTSLDLTYAVRVNNIDLPPVDFDLTQVNNLFSNIGVVSNTQLCRRISNDNLTVNGYGLAQKNNVFNFYPGQIPNGTILPYNSTVDTSLLFYSYQVWVRRGTCAPIKIGTIDLSTEVKPEFLVTRKPGTFTCGESNCDGEIIVEIVGKSNSRAPYTVNVDIVGNSDTVELPLIRQKSKKVKAVSSTCDESCGYSVSVPICALEYDVFNVDSTNGNVTGGNYYYSHKVEVFDKYGCRIKPKSSGHEPEIQNGLTDWYIAGGGYLQNDPNPSQYGTSPAATINSASYYEPRPHNQVKTIIAKATNSGCVNCCDAYINSIDFLNKYNQRIILIERNTNGAYALKNANNDVMETEGPAANQFNHFKIIQLCGLSNLPNNSPFNFLVRLIEHPKEFVNPGVYITKSIVNSPTSNSNLLKSLIDFGLFSNMCVGRYCYEISISTRKWENTNPEANVNNYTRNCSCVINFCVDVNCTPPLNII